MLKNISKRIIDALIVPVVRCVEPLRGLFAHVGKSVARDGYYPLRKRFIANGETSNHDVKTRESIVRRFETIDRSVLSQTSPTDGLFLAEALLSLAAGGDVVECGCYCGASTAKLSIICELLGKQLHVFDSFEGLPGTRPEENREYSIRRSAEGVDWYGGSFASSLGRVKRNVESYGAGSVCSYHQGWFADTLTSSCLPESICFTFADVDLPTSATECLLAIWPRLSEGAVYFSHDVAFLGVLKTMLDRRMWRSRLDEDPPTFYGAGTGLSDASPFLGFAVKGSDVTPEYVNSLTIEK